MKTIIWKRNNQRGQASLEMILLLVIGMLITLGLVYRFNTAFKKYTVDMFGTYYRCLLETGELPGVGSVCKDRKARFDIANGRALIKSAPGSGGGGSGGGTGSGGGGGSGGGSGGGGKGSSGGSGSSNNQTKRGESGNEGSGGGSSGGSSEAVGGSGSGSGGGSGSVIGRLRGLQKPRSTAVGSVANLSREDQNDSGGDPLAVYAGTRASNDGLRRAQTKMDFKMDGGQYMSEATASVASVTASAPKKNVAAGDSLRPRKATENMDRKPAGNLKDDKGGGLEFGRLFKFFIILAIIVAIVVFLGGQVLQISKSGEK